MSKSKKSSPLDRAIIALLVALVVGLQPVTVNAGTRGAYMNSAGYGKAIDSVVYAGVTNIASSISMYYPCAAVAPRSTFTCNAAYAKGLPPGTPSTVYCQSKGAPNYIWSIQSYVTGGATADNPELESRINVLPAECAAYTLDTQAAFSDAYSGTITVNATATAGAAVWLRGLEYLGTGLPTSLEDLLANSTLRFDVLVAGPFTFDANNCTALNIPFTTQTGHANLYCVADGVAKSIPFTITCPGDLVFGCGDAVVYPPAQVTGGCGSITVNYDPPASALPAGVTSITATATDQAGNEAQCTFNVTRQALAFEGFYSPISGTGGSCDSPVRSVSRGSVIPVKFSTACSGSSYLAGTPTLSIRKCPATPIGGGNFQLVGSEWHFNWDTSGLAKGVYELAVTLQDGSLKTVYVRVR